MDIIANEIDGIHALSSSLRRVNAIERSAEHVMSTRQLSHSCNLLVARIHALQQMVTRFDQGIAGTEIGSLAELGLRAQTLAVLLLLDELCNAVRRDPSGRPELFAGRLSTMEDVTSFLFDSLARINRYWLRYRVTPYETATLFPSRVFRTVSSSLYRSATRCAQDAMVDLLADPGLAYFLRIGSSCTDAPHVRRACEQLVHVLGLALTQEPDPGLFLAAAVLEPEELHDLMDDGKDLPRLSAEAL